MRNQNSRHWRRRKPQLTEEAFRVECATPGAASAASSCCLTSECLQGLWDNTSLLQNVGGIFQPARRLPQALSTKAKLHQLPSHGSVAAPASHKLQFDHFPCSTLVWASSMRPQELPTAYRRRAFSSHGAKAQASSQ